MRVHMPSIDPTVSTYPDANRSVILRLRSLRITMTPAEALHLADLLVDATETTKDSND